jgi:LysR family glycine cleavage system transcriptional activator
MLRRLPPLPTLAAFEAVSRHRSFIRAAQELCITRSAVSHRITTLEAYFGTRLFVRHRGIVSLTPEGALLLETVINTFSSLEVACERLAGRVRSAVRISVGLEFASAWFMEKMGEYHHLHPDVDLEINALRIRFMHANKLSCLQSGEADVVITHGTPAEWKGYEYLEILKCRMFPVCSPAYRQAAHLTDNPQSLLNAEFLRLAGQVWRPWFRAAGLVCQEPDRGPLFSHAGLMIDAASSGQGVALVREVLVEKKLKAGSLVRLFKATTDSVYYAVYAPQASASPEIVTFLDWLRDSSAKIAPTMSVTVGTA